MRLLVSGLLVFLSMQAHAQDCGAQNDSLLKLNSWSAREADRGTQISMEMQSAATKDIRMIKGSARFYDPFGESIANLELDPDVSIKAGATFNETGTYFVARLAKIHPEDVTTIICVEGVVYADGEKEEFR